MAAIFGTESYETGAVGDLVTDGNTTHSSVGAGWTFTDSPAPPVGLGTLLARVEVGAAVASYAQATFTAASDIAVPRMYVRFPSVPATGSVDIATIRSGTSIRARLGISNGKYVLRNGSTIVWTSTTDAAPAVWNRLEWRLDNNTGQQQLRIFRGTNHHGTTPDEDSGARTLTAGGAFEVGRFGPANNALTTTWVAFYDGLIVSDVTWPGPAYTGDGGGGAVTVDAGADQTGVEPWSAISLAASSAGGTVAGWAWTQLQGTPVTLTGVDTASVSFEAPAALQGESLQFEAAATYAGGIAKDYVNVTVRAVTERAVIGGREVPLRVIAVYDPDLSTGTWDPAAVWQSGAAWVDH